MINTNVLIRQDWFIVDWYRDATSNSANYLDKSRFQELKRLGDQALANDDIAKLRQVLSELLSIRVHVSSGDGMYEVANILKG